eukprot:m.6844 g.6844  ORF g.6844 m.6844 type:complete len:98 (+) comp17014_c0_seq1:320-613(+)
MTMSAAICTSQPCELPSDGRCLDWPKWLKKIIDHECVVSLVFAWSCFHDDVTLYPLLAHKDCLFAVFGDDHFVNVASHLIASKAQPESDRDTNVTDL